MYPYLLLYLAICSCLNQTISRWSENEKSVIYLQKSNNATYQNTEQECMKLLIKKYNLHKTNDFTYQIYYIYRSYQVIVNWLRNIFPTMQYLILCMPIPLIHSWLDYLMVSFRGKNFIFTSKNNQETNNCQKVDFKAKIGPNW